MPSVCRLQYKKAVDSEKSHSAGEWLLHVSACAVSKQSITWVAEQARDVQQTHAQLRHAEGTEYLKCCYW